MNFNFVPMKFTNMTQLVQYYYGSLMKSVQKDAPMLSSTSGIYNAIYGPRCFAALNQETNIWAALPKEAFGQSGWRAISARPESSGGGIAENGSLPATAKYTFKEISAKPATIVHTYDVSLTQQILATTDDAVGTLADVRALNADRHKEMMNVMLATEFGTAVGYNLESIDRVCATTAERTACGEDDGDEDIYSIDRSDSNTWAEGYVGHNSGTDRALSKPLLRDLIIDNVPKNGGSYPNLCITGTDKLSDVSALFEAQGGVGGALGQSTVTFGTDGISVAGQGAGLIVTTIHTVPMVISKDTTIDTGSRFYALDTKPQGGLGSVLSIEVAFPTQNFEAGVSNGNLWAPQLVGDEGAFVTLAQLKCKNFKRQGKLRDLL